MQRNSSESHNSAVVRVRTEDGGGNASCGSGTCVGWTDEYGLILTAYHVIQDNRGQVTVDFWPPGQEAGERLKAKVVASNRQWDVAALVVKRPPYDSALIPFEMRFPCIKLGSTKPALGDTMTVAGYGKGGNLASYREATGVVTAFLMPSRSDASDIVMMSAKARSGDSGGPLLDEHGTLVGVLFGSDGGGAHGSHCERVRWFLKKNVEKEYPKLIQKVMNLDFWWSNPNNLENMSRKS